MGIGDRLKQERERLGLNQTELAAAAGASKNSQYNYEKGERSPDAAYLAAVAQKGVDILYVVTGVPTPQVVEGFTEVEDKLVNQYRALSQADQEAVDRIVGAMWEISARGKD
ncbi:helix-turn-helix transcriptional regulator [Pseudomonas lundensis]|uniref:helix-turn-helix domain-containing protein n=1 Tax=Pseudomonas TaxID=286 RepID=UPI00147518BD|nr:helix-turn-helix transcriptional regulator [Pseudomonas sp.]MBS5840547.1 helix-turn-helix transcriptional regulator [Pseudomonas sp.]NNA14961.1 helix-turn-helix transcriptional regulator [Pseudomonas lundensis]